jgi:hypothetical protein
MMCINDLKQLARDPIDAANLSQATEINLKRFAESMAPNHLKVHKKPIILPYILV